MRSNNHSSSGGIGFCGLLTIVFIVLKICEVIDWSWWWVLSPIWISAILVVAILAVWIAIIVHEDKPKKRGTGKWKF
jgi:hypothetical protein